jgi:type II restriction enzyme
MADQAVSALSQRWREDAGATYQSWFLWPERLKNSNPKRAAASRKGHREQHLLSSL